MNWEEIKKLSNVELAKWATEISFNQQKSQRQVARELGLGKDTVGKLLRDRGIVRNQEERCYDVSEDIAKNENKADVEPLFSKKGECSVESIETLLMAINENISGMRKDLKSSSISKKERSLVKESNEMRPLKNDEELHPYSGKMYPSIKERLDNYTKDSAYTKQQVFNMLLDQVLKQQGY